MGRSVAIPVRVIRSGQTKPPPAPEPAGPGQTVEVTPLWDEQAVAAGEPMREEPLPKDAPDAVEEAIEPARDELPVEAFRDAEKVVGPEVGVHEMPDEWKDQALRLQADMDNYRKRQRWLAQGQIEEERQRLLRSFLRIVDDLERALDAPPGDGEDLRRGMRMIHEGALQMLQKEGVEQIQAGHQPFDPNWHEAVAAVPGQGNGVEPNTVIQVMEPGYRIGERLLKPARVVVAV